MINRNRSKDISTDRRLYLSSPARLSSSLSLIARNIPCNREEINHIHRPRPPCDGDPETRSGTHAFGTFIHTREESLTQHPDSFLTFGIYYTIQLLGRQEWGSRAIAARPLVRSMHDHNLERPHHNRRMGAQR